MEATGNQPAIGPLAAAIATAAEAGPVLAILSDFARADGVAAALSGMSDAEVLLLPERDTLPGERSASPAVAGARNAVLRRLRSLRTAKKLVLVASAEATVGSFAPPAAYDAPATGITVGEAIDLDSFCATLEGLGYWPDERVDEAGEFVRRGAVLDIFPAAHAPVRIDLDDGKVAAIRRYDPVSQLGTDAVESVTFEPLAEPAGEAALLDHIDPAWIHCDPDVARRRAQLAEPDGWDEAIAGIDAIVVPAAEPGRRFVELRDPARAARKAIRDARAAGERVAILGCARDLRFLQRALGETPVAVTEWRDVVAAEPGSLLTIETLVDRGWREAGLLAIAAADLLGSRAGKGRTAASAGATPFDTVDIRIGDALIHEDHGLGLLRGVERLDGGGDAIRLEYAGDTMRLVPVAEAGKLWRYGAAADGVTLDRLDGSSWTARRSEIDRAVAETARGLVRIAAERAEASAPVLELGADYERIAARFPFQPTADQDAAFAAVAADLASGKPMDRLVIGDVGYGKTEVAVRAAAIAACAGRQVAVVAPTTVLVRQHLETFRRRLDGSGIEIVQLSRLSTPAEARAAKAALADGSARIAIGTTAVAGKGVRFADLGLVVIDEEQRFGVAAKQKLRTMGQSVHVLSLSATPIPRTLQSALVGLQQISVIATPPARRQPIRTRVVEYDGELVRAALLREKQRGGQSFVVVPRIEDMAPLAGQLARLVPELSLVQAHGKLPAREVDEAMVAFAAGQGDVLLATNIIEAGLDVPRANTMIVARADRFGLAQLHQLRGRVGRGRTRGQILLLTEPGQKIGAATLQRLRTLEALDRLGAGFAIAARDLDLRGAGELLGPEQAGHIKLIGVDLYQHLLGAAVKAARGEPVEFWTPDLNLGDAGVLPEDWIPEAELRATLYVRIARAATLDALDAVAAEVEDRFGAPPGPAARLFRLARLGIRARGADILRIDAGPAAIAFTPRRRADPPLDVLEAKGDRWLLRRPGGDDRIDEVEALLEEMAGDE